MLSVVNAIRLHRVVYPLLLPSPPRGCRSERDADPRAEKKPGDVEKPEFRSAMEPADDLAGLGFADKYRERAKVIVSSLAHIKARRPSLITAASAAASSSVTEMSTSSFDIFAADGFGRRRHAARLKPAHLGFFDPSDQFSRCGDTEHRASEGSQTMLPYRSAISAADQVGSGSPSDSRRAR